MKLKKQKDMSSLSKMFSKLKVEQVKTTPSPDSLREDLLNAIKNDDGTKLLKLLNTPNSLLNELSWDSELYFAIGKYISPSSFDILKMLCPFVKHAEKHKDSFFEGIACGDNHTLLGYVMQHLNHKFIASKLGLFMDTHAMRCFKMAFNHVCKVSNAEEFKVIMRHLMNRNIGTLNTEAITTIQQCITTTGRSS